MAPANERDVQLQEALVKAALALERIEKAEEKQAEIQQVLTEIRDMMAPVFAKHAGYDDTAWERVMKTTLASERGREFGDAIVRKAFLLGAMGTIGAAITSWFNILEKVSK